MDPQLVGAPLVSRSPPGLVLRVEEAFSNRKGERENDHRMVARMDYPALSSSARGHLQLTEYILGWHQLSNNHNEHSLQRYFGRRLRRVSI